ncbi:MAG: MBL fold metallo-hydrolase [Parvularculaceae bacterium]|nr:MBL fold metallo-hydrolase [Parvularculaceae bacterium]
MSPRIRRLIAPNPGPFTYTGSGTYVIEGDDGAVVIDPGPAHSGHQRELAASARVPIRWILITHTHRDHCGGADELKDLTGAQTYGYGPHPSADGEASPALDEGADFGFRPDHELRDGEVLEVVGLRFEAVHTPGHIGNHLCFALDEERALFTGDHIMGWATTVVAPPDGDMTQYMQSLDKLLLRDDTIYYPTHGAPITDPAPFVRAVKQHREGRDAAILATLDQTALSPMEIVDQVYVGLSDSLKFAAALNVVAHLKAHVAEGRVVEDVGRYRRLA